MLAGTGKRPRGPNSMPWLNSDLCVSLLAPHAAQGGQLSRAQTQSYGDATDANGISRENIQEVASHGELPWQCPHGQCQVGSRAGLMWHTCLPCRHLLAVIPWTNPGELTLLMWGWGRWIQTDVGGATQSSCALWMLRHVK